MLDKNVSNDEILRGAMSLYRLSVKQVALILEIKEQSVRNARSASGRGLSDIKLQYLLDLMAEVSDYRQDGDVRSAVAVPVWILNGGGDPVEAVYVHRCPVTSASRVIRARHSLIGSGDTVSIPDYLAIRGCLSHRVKLVPSHAWLSYSEKHGPLSGYGSAFGLDIGTEEL